MLKKKTKRERGQSIVLIALAIVGLVGLTALAIDGGNAFSDKRHAQNAADSAALSAALAKVRDRDWQTAGLGIAGTNGYSNDGRNTVIIHTCDISPFCDAPYDGSNADAAHLHPSI